MHLKVLFIMVLLVLTVSNAQWVKTSNLSNSSYVRSFAGMNSNLFVGTLSDGVFLTTDSGISWKGVNNGLPINNVLSLVVSDTRLIAGLDYGKGVYLSTNKGANWTAMNNGLTNAYVYSLFCNPNGIGGINLYAGVLWQGVYLLSENDTSWKVMNTGLTNLVVRSFGVIKDKTGGENLFTATHGGVYRLTNKESSWVAINTGLTDTLIESLATIDTILYAAATNEVFRSTNMGSTWSSVLAQIRFPKVFVASDSVIFAISLGDGVFVSHNKGESWVEMNTGLTSKYVHSINLFNGSIYIGTIAGVWKRPLSELITSVNMSSGSIPEIFSLEQNYPNPFNPTTIISFTIAKKEFTSLNVYDILGNEIANLISEEVNPGNYLKEWNASLLPSGVYYYRLQSGKYAQTKKLMFIK